MAENKLGNEPAARHAMQTLVNEIGDAALYQQSQVLAQWGEKDAAFATLNRALQVGDSGLLFARSDPFLDPIRNDPRFDDLLNRLATH